MLPFGQRNRRRRRENRLAGNEGGRAAIGGTRITWRGLTTRPTDRRAPRWFRQQSRGRQSEPAPPVSRAPKERTICATNGSASVTPGVLMGCGELFSPVGLASKQHGCGNIVEGGVGAFRLHSFVPLMTARTAANLHPDSGELPHGLCAHRPPFGSAALSTRCRVGLHCHGAPLARRSEGIARASSLVRRVRRALAGPAISTSVIASGAGICDRRSRASLLSPAAARISAA